MRIPDWLNNHITECIQGDLDGIFGDAQLSTTLDYMRFTAGTSLDVDDDTGVVGTDPYTTVEDVPAFVGQATSRMVHASGGNLTLGDVVALFRRSDAAGPYTDKDQVVHLSTRYNVEHIDGALSAAASTQIDLVLVKLTQVGRNPVP